MIQSLKYRVTTTNEKIVFAKSYSTHPITGALQQPPRPGVLHPARHAQAFDAEPLTADQQGVGVARVELGHKRDPGERELLEHAAAVPVREIYEQVTLAPLRPSFGARHRGTAAPRHRGTEAPNGRLRWRGGHELRRRAHPR